MLREFLTLFVPLILPTALYFVWLRVARSPQLGSALSWRGTPWVWLALAGVALTALVLFTVTVHFGTAVSGTYVAPHLEHGKIVPGHIEPHR